MSRDDPVEGRIDIGGLRYFFKRGKQRGTKVAFYAGPADCPDGVHRHLTAILDSETGEINNLHLTRENMSARIQKWSRNPNRIRSEITTWIVNNSVPLETRNVDQLDSDYTAVSGWQVLVGLQMFMGLTRLLEWFVFWPLSHMGVIRFSVTEDPERNRIRLIGRFDLTRMMQIIRKFRPFKAVAQSMLPVVITRLGPKLTRLTLKRASQISKGDISFLMPRKQEMTPIFIVRSKDYLQLDARKVFEKIGSLYEDMELSALIPNPEKIIASGSSIPIFFESSMQASTT